MLIALVSTAESRDLQGRLLTIGGETVAGHQIAAALALGCESIICVVEADEVVSSAEIDRMRQQAAKGGAGFHVASDIFGVSSRVTASDSLVVFAGGILPHRTAVGKVAAERTGIGAVRSAAGEASEFERIDPDYVWGGILRAPGTIVERFAAIAPGGDPISGLLRTALQSGVRLVELPEDEEPVVVRTLEQASAESERQRRRRLGRADWRVPGDAIAINLALRHGSLSGVSPGSGSLLSGVPYMLVGLAILLGWTGWITLAFLTLAAASVLRMLRVHVGREPIMDPAGATVAYLGYLFDAAVLAVSWFALPTTAADPESHLAGLMIIIAILALPRLAIRYQLSTWKVAARDRFALSIGLAICAMSGSFAFAAGILLVLILAAMLLFPRGAQLTRS